jgi:hypothetical protein
VNNLINVARYHLVNRVGFVLVPWGVTIFAFLVCLIIFWRIAPSPNASHVGAVASMFVVFFVLGVQSVAQSLPFGLSLGVSRRTYFAGTVLLVLGLSAAYGLLLAVLQEVERATAGWGVDMHFFRVSYLLNGPWYQTWLTSFVGLALLFVCGMWFGLVWRRWNIVGLVAFIASLVTALLIAALAITWAHVWDGVGHFFTVLSSTGLTGVLAALAVVLAAGGLATMRRVTV